MHRIKQPEPCDTPRSAALPAARLTLSKSSTRRNPQRLGRIRPDGEFACSSLSGEAQFGDGSGVARFGGEESTAEASPAQAVKTQAKNGLQAWLAESRRLRTQLQTYGVAGLLAYGLLNTIYYSAAFLIIWLYIVKVPRGIGLSEACKQFVAAVSLTWASSQVTKLPRAALAVLVAPIADGCLIFLQARLRLRRRRNAALVIVAACFTLVGLIFAATVAMWA